jgi:hypothetical protein
LVDAGGAASWADFVDAWLRFDLPSLADAFRYATFHRFKRTSFFNTSQDELLLVDALKYFCQP